MSGEGQFGVVVWPVYIGAALEDSTPPHTIAEPRNNGYERGTIVWYPVGDEIRGRARLLLPPGRYTHFVYYHHPTRMQSCGVAKMDHPLHCIELTVLDVDPIVNHDMALLTARG